MMECFPANVSPAAPGGTGNTLGIDNEWKIILGVRKQTCHSIAVNSFQRPRRGLSVLQGFVADTFINRLHRVCVFDEFVSPAASPAGTVFF